MESPALSVWAQGFGRREGWVVVWCILHLNFNPQMNKTPTVLMTDVNMLSLLRDKCHWLVLFIWRNIQPRQKTCSLQRNAIPFFICNALQTRQEFAWHVCPGIRGNYGKKCQVTIKVFIVGTKLDQTKYKSTYQFISQEWIKLANNCQLHNSILYSNE